MAPLRFGLVGTGYWALNTHGAALATSPHATLEGVWGRDPAKAGEVAGRLGTRPFAEFDELLDKVDAVAMAVPPDVQADLAVRAAGAGRHLLLDKPVALDVAAARAVAGAVSASGVAALVFFTARFRPEAEEWARASVVVGPWHTAHFVQYANIYQAGSPYAGSTWRRQHGALWDIGPHALAALVPILGPVNAVGARRGPDGSDTVHLVLAHGPGTPGSSSSGTSGTPGSTGRAAATSSTSVLSLSLTMPPAAAASQLVLYGEKGTRTRPDGRSEAVEAFHNALADLAEMVGSGQREHRCDCRFGLEVVEVLAAAERAIDIPGEQPQH